MRSSIMLALFLLILLSTVKGSDLLGAIDEIKNTTARYIVQTNNMKLPLDSLKNPDISHHTDIYIEIERKFLELDRDSDPPHMIIDSFITMALDFYFEKAHSTIYCRDIIKEGKGLEIDLLNIAKRKGFLASRRAGDYPFEEKCNQYLGLFLLMPVLLFLVLGLFIYGRKDRTKKKILPSFQAVKGEKEQKNNNSKIVLSNSIKDDDTKKSNIAVKAKTSVLDTELSKLKNQLAKKESWEAATKQKNLEGWLQHQVDYPEDREKASNAIEVLILQRQAQEDIITLKHWKETYADEPFILQINTSIQKLRIRTFYASHPRPDGYFDRYALKNEKQANSLFQLNTKEKAGRFNLLIESEAWSKRVADGNLTDLSIAIEKATRSEIENINTQDGEIELDKKHWKITKKIKVAY